MPSHGGGWSLLHYVDWAPMRRWGVGRVESDGHLVERCRVLGGQRELAKIASS